MAKGENPLDRERLESHLRLMTLRRTVAWILAGASLGALIPSVQPVACAAEAAAPAPRAARSVHLGYPAPDSTAFYLEMAVDRSTPGSYFMACGWSTGYYGIQELGNGRKVAIFSVWDPSKGDDAKTVKLEDRVELLHQGEGVRIRRFGGEGTGGQCMTDFDWKLGETNRFLVTATVQSNRTAYAGYLWLSDKREWQHLVTFRTRTGGQPLRGLYSFVEDFRRDGKSVSDVRRARYFNGWVKAVTGAWSPLAKARFTASGAEWESKENIDAGVAGGQFYLATGGDTRMSRELRSLIETAPAPTQPPADLPTPETPVGR